MPAWPDRTINHAHSSSYRQRTTLSHALSGLPSDLGLRGLPRRRLLCDPCPLSCVRTFVSPLDRGSLALSLFFRSKIITSTRQREPFLPLEQRGGCGSSPLTAVYGIRVWEVTHTEKKNRAEDRRGPTDSTGGGGTETPMTCRPPRFFFVMVPLLTMSILPTV